MTSINERKTKLENWLAELEHMDAGAQDERATVTLDQQSVGRLNRMDAMQRQQIAKETHRRCQLERSRIAAALARLRVGEYGWCAICGLGISERRLDADPAAHLCIECAE